MFYWEPNDQKMGKRKTRWLVTPFDANVVEQQVFYCSPYTNRSVYTILFRPGFRRKKESNNRAPVKNTQSIKCQCVWFELDAFSFPDVFSTGMATYHAFWTARYWPFLEVSARNLGSWLTFVCLDFVQRDKNSRTRKVKMEISWKCNGVIKFLLSFHCPSAVETPLANGVPQGEEKYTITSHLFCSKLKSWKLSTANASKWTRGINRVEKIKQKNKIRRPSGATVSKDIVTVSQRKRMVSDKRSWKRKKCTTHKCFIFKVCHIRFSFHLSFLQMLFGFSSRDSEKNGVSGDCVAA